MPMTATMPELSVNQIKEAIANRQKAAPVDIVALANDFGIRVWEMQLPPNVSGKIFRDISHGGLSGFSIGVNSAEHAVRKRFTIAHEIAHFLLHRNHLEQGDVVDDAMYRSGLTSTEETQANSLAAQILMPMPLIQALIRSGSSSPEKLAEKLEVSVTAIKIRLGYPT